MTPKYTGDDVKELVRIASYALILLEPRNSRTVPALRSALAPFQSDPEEELIEAMTAAYMGDLAHLYDRDMAITRMRRALAVVKERGLPK